MRLNVLVRNWNAPDHLARAVHRGVLILPRGDLAQALSHGREVHVRRRQMPPPGDAEPRVLVREVFEGQQSAPDGCPCEGNIIIWKRRVSDDLVGLCQSRESSSSPRGSHLGKHSPSGFHPHRPPSPRPHSSRPRTPAPRRRLRPPGPRFSRASSPAGSRPRARAPGVRTAASSSACGWWAGSSTRRWASPGRPRARSCGAPRLCGRSWGTVSVFWQTHTIVRILPVLTCSTPQCTGAHWRACLPRPATPGCSTSWR